MTTTQGSGGFSMNQSRSISRSGSTPYHILINQEENLLRVKLSGHWAYRDSKAFWAMVVREALSRSLQKALVMFQLSEPLTLKQACELAGSAKSTFLEHDIYMAVVDSNRRSFPNAAFWQLETNGAFSSALFNQLSDAEQWLDNH